MYQWEKGISLSFFQKNRGNVLVATRLFLIRCVPMDLIVWNYLFRMTTYFKKYRFTEGDNAEQLFQYCESIGLKIWSIHLPFSDVWDLSCDDAQKALQDDVKLLEAAGRANISVAVIHPSFEPIAEEARNKRLSNAKK